MTTFDDLGLAEPILKAVKAEGYNNPTPIQAHAIPPLMKGKDVIGIAQTGTGKTASFVLPLLHRIIRQKLRRRPGTCSALIITPTRELASQIADNITRYSAFTDLETTLVFGGVKPGNQIRQLKAGTDIVVATPGRLLDHMNSGTLNLIKLKNLVIDEADQMLDMGFLPDIKRIVKKLSPSRQTALFSATMPTQIRKLANDLLTEPEEIRVAAVSRPVERICQSIRYVEKADKRRVLAEILSVQAVERAVVFTRTKRGADRVCKHLTASGLNAAAIHGNKSQPQRDRAMDAFRAGKITVLVATDIAARGIDIDDISHVVNFEIPNIAESYVHRIGRTARAGKTGIAISLCDPSERGLVKDIEKLIGYKLPCDDVAGNRDGDRNPAVTPACNHKSKHRNTADKRRGKSTASKRSRRNASKRKKPVQKSAAPEQPNDGLVRMLSNLGPTNARRAKRNRHQNNNHGSRP